MRRSECQKRHYRVHVRLCGKLLSENIDLPLHTAFPTSQLDPFLLRQMQTLARDDIAR